MVLEQPKILRAKKHPVFLKKFCFKTIKNCEYKALEYSVLLESNWQIIFYLLFHNFVGKNFIFSDIFIYLTAATLKLYTTHETEQTHMIKHIVYSKAYT